MTSAAVAIATAMCTHCAGSGVVSHTSRSSTSGATSSGSSGSSCRFPALSSTSPSASVITHRHPTSVAIAIAADSDLPVIDLLDLCVPARTFCVVGDKRSGKSLITDALRIANDAHSRTSIAISARDCPPPDTIPLPAEVRDMHCVHQFKCIDAPSIHFRDHTPQSCCVSFSAFTLASPVFRCSMFTGEKSNCSTICERAHLSGFAPVLREAVNAWILTRPKSMASIHTLHAQLGLLTSEPMGWFMDQLERCTANHGALVLLDPLDKLEHGHGRQRAWYYLPGSAVAQLRQSHLDRVAKWREHCHSVLLPTTYLLCPLSIWWSTMSCHCMYSEGTPL